MIPDYIPQFVNGIELNEPCDECQNSSADSELCEVNQNPNTSPNILENNKFPSLDTKTDSVCPSVPLPAKDSGTNKSDHKLRCSNSEVAFQ